MQTLLLATTIALTNPVSISSLSDTEVLNESIQQEMNSVRIMVQYQTRVDIQDTFLFQASESIKLAKKNTVSLQSDLGE